MCKKVKALCLLLALFVFLTCSAMADTVVTSLAELKSVLQDNTITEFTVTKTISLTESIDGKGKKLIRATTDPVFDIPAGYNVSISNLKLDGGNNWTFDPNNTYDEALQKFEPVSPSTAFIQSNGLEANKFMIVNSGTLTISNCDIRNNYGVGDIGVFYTKVSDTVGSTLTIRDTIIDHCASTGRNAVLYANGAEKNGTAITANAYIEKGTIITGSYVGFNGGVLRAYTHGNVTMNGGKISGTRGVNCNGSVILIWENSTFTLNDGEISDNSSVRGSNGRCSVIYVHTNSHFVMNGGIIQNNIGGSRGAVDTAYTSVDGNKATALITGGTILNNIKVNTNTIDDVWGGSKFKITGGTFSQDVSEWVSDGFALWKNNDSTYCIITQDEYDARMAKLAAKAVSSLPQTGDNSVMIFWAALLSLSAAAFALRRRARA